MRRHLLLPALILVAACDGPSLSFRGVAAQRVEVDGSIFSVRHQAGDAEAIRLSREWLPETATILARAERAIAAASGCRVVAIDGDQAIQRASLDC